MSFFDFKVKISNIAKMWTKNSKLTGTSVNTVSCSELLSNSIIISLTSFPARIKTIHKTIETIINQTYKPDKIILWLGEEQFPNKDNDLPQELLNLKDKGLEICYCEDIRSYTKLIPTLKKYPNDIIVTIDDDILYMNDWLEKLVKAYQENPNYIHCHRAHLILFNKQGKILPYKKWKFAVSRVKTSYNNFLTGVGGVLYPPNSLHPDIFNEQKFKELAPFADDIWFWAMAVLNGTKINVIKNNYTKLKYVDGTQECGLYQINVNSRKNDEQLANVLKEYPQIMTKIEKITNVDVIFNLVKKIFSISTGK